VRLPARAGLNESDASVRVIESWVNRDPNQYRANDSEYDRKLVRYLIDAFLLKKRIIVFPGPTETPGAPQSTPKLGDE
jgi:hypothetical protein